MKFLHGVPCKHPGCASHISHPCEGCGRVGAMGDSEHIAGGFFIVIDELRNCTAEDWEKLKEVLDRKKKLLATAGQEQLPAGDVSH